MKQYQERNSLLREEAGDGRFVFSVKPEDKRAFFKLANLVKLRHVHIVKHTFVSEVEESNSYFLPNQNLFLNNQVILLPKPNQTVNIQLRTHVGRTVMLSWPCC